jgi:hypothetical protein
MLYCSSPIVGWLGKGRAPSSLAVKRAIILGALCLSLAIPVRATTITVQEVGVSPTEIATISVTGFYTGGVYAGVNNLIVDGVPINGFCIDPFHFSLSSSPGYQFVALANAPKPPATMGTTSAAEISKLWAMTYSPTITAPEAAGLQIAIWEIVGGSNFSVIGNDYGASQLLTDVQSYTGPSAHLIALSGPGQDYVIAVPDNAKSVTLLVIALFGIALVRWHTVGTRVKLPE